MPKTPEMPGLSSEGKESHAMTHEQVQKELEDMSKRNYNVFSQNLTGKELRHYGGAAGIVGKFAKECGYTPQAMVNSQRDEIEEMTVHHILSKGFKNDPNFVQPAELSSAIQELVQSKESLEQALEEYHHYEILAEFSAEIIQKAHDVEGLEKALQTALDKIREEKDRRFVLSGENARAFSGKLRDTDTIEQMKDAFESMKERGMVVDVTK